MTNNYSWEEMRELYNIYASDEYGNRTPFIKKLETIGVSEEEASLIWKAFDVATEECWAFIYRNQIKY